MILARWMREKPNSTGKYAEEKVRSGARSRSTLLDAHPTSLPTPSSSGNCFQDLI
jgi:hypothetical protein